MPDERILQSTLFGWALPILPSMWPKQKVEACDSKRLERNWSGTRMSVMRKQQDTGKVGELLAN